MNQFNFQQKKLKYHGLLAFRPSTLPLRHSGGLHYLNCTLFKLFENYSEDIAFYICGLYGLG